MPHRAFDLAVCIGRFQPFHTGHLALLREALRVARRCVVVVGSAWQARTPRNPWTWQERAEMVRQSLPETERERIDVLPMRDYYDQPRWVAAVRQAVADAVPGARSVALVGHFKDTTSAYLRDFPQWKLQLVDKLGHYDGTPLREALLGAPAGQAQAALAGIAASLPANTLEFLRTWLDAVPLAHLREEWQALVDGRAEWAGSPYPPVFVTVDAVIRCHGRVLLIRRGQAPGKGLLAVPGGFLEQRDTVYQSAVRELEEETNLAMLEPALRKCLKEVAVFDHPDRSQRGRVITHAH